MAELSWLPEGSGRKYSVGGLIFDWNGGHTINIRHPGDENDFDVISVGDFAEEAAGVAEVESSIRDYLAGMNQAEPGGEPTADERLADTFGVDRRANMGDRIREFGLTATVTHGAPDSAAFPQSDGWTVRIKGPQGEMTVPFYMGYGLNGRQPELAEVLNSLAMDASGFENTPNFEDWASEYGYDADSRSAERTFKHVEEEARRLRALLGEDAYEKLLWMTEGL